MADPLGISYGGTAGVGGQAGEAQIFDNPDANVPISGILQNYFIHKDHLDYRKKKDEEERKAAALNNEFKTPFYAHNEEFAKRQQGIIGEVKNVLKVDPNLTQAQNRMFIKGLHDEYNRDALNSHDMKAGYENNQQLLAANPDKYYAGEYKSKLNQFFQLPIKDQMQIGLPNPDEVFDMKGYQQKTEALFRPQGFSRDIGNPVLEKKQDGTSHYRVDQIEDSAVPEFAMKDKETGKMVRNENNINSFADSELQTSPNLDNHFARQAQQVLSQNPEIMGGNFGLVKRELYKQSNPNLFGISTKNAPARFSNINHFEIENAKQQAKRKGEEDDISHDVARSGAIRFAPTRNADGTVTNNHVGDAFSFAISPNKKGKQPTISAPTSGWMDENGRKLNLFGNINATLSSVGASVRLSNGTITRVNMNDYIRDHPNAGAEEQNQYLEDKTKEIINNTKGLVDINMFAEGSYINQKKVNTNQDKLNVSQKSRLNLLRSKARKKDGNESISGKYSDLTPEDKSIYDAAPEDDKPRIDQLLKQELEGLQSIIETDAESTARIPYSYVKGRVKLKKEAQVQIDQAESSLRAFARQHNEKIKGNQDQLSEYRNWAKKNYPKLAVSKNTEDQRKLKELHNASLK